MIKFNAGYWASCRGVHLLPYIKVINNQFVFLIQLGWLKWNFDLEWEK